MDESKAYRVELAPRVERQLSRMAPSVRMRIAAAIDALANSPRPQGSIKLSGTVGDLRIRVGDYRIIYEVRDDILVVFVVEVGHRREVYGRR